MLWELTGGTTERAVNTWAKTWIKQSWHSPHLFLYLQRCCWSQSSVWSVWGRSTRSEQKATQSWWQTRWQVKSCKGRLWRINILCFYRNFDVKRNFWSKVVWLQLLSLEMKQSHAQNVMLDCPLLVIRCKNTQQTRTLLWINSFLKIPRINFLYTASFNWPLKIRSNTARLVFTNLKFIIPKTGTSVLSLFHVDIFVCITELDTVMPVITVTAGGRRD